MASNIEFDISLRGVMKVINKMDFNTLIVLLTQKRNISLFFVILSNLIPGYTFIFLNFRYYFVQLDFVKLTILAFITAFPIYVLIQLTSDGFDTFSKNWLKDTRLQLSILSIETEISKSNSILESAQGLTTELLNIESKISSLEAVTEADKVILKDLRESFLDTRAEGKYITNKIIMLIRERKQELVAIKQARDSELILTAVENAFAEFSVFLFAFILPLFSYAMRILISDFNISELNLNPAVIHVAITIYVLSALQWIRIIRERFPKKTK